MNSLQFGRVYQVQAVSQDLGDNVRLGLDRVQQNREKGIPSELRVLPTQDVFVVTQEVMPTGGAISGKGNTLEQLQGGLFQIIKSSRLRTIATVQSEFETRFLNEPDEVVSQ